MSNLDRDRLKQDVRDANHAARKIAPSLIAWIVVAILVVGGVGVGIWYFKVATSGVKGAGDATKQVNSGANRLQAQAKYSKLYTGIQASDANLDSLADTYRMSPSQKTLTDLTGSQQICRRDVAEYNAMATNPATKPWLPMELPSVVGNDPATDCKPSNPVTPPSSK